MKIEVIGLDPPCKKCTELLENARKAVAELGIEAEVVNDEFRYINIHASS